MDLGNFSLLAIVPTFLAAFFVIVSLVDIKSLTFVMEQSTKVRESKCQNVDLSSSKDAYLLGLMSMTNGGQR